MENLETIRTEVLRKFDEHYLKYPQYNGFRKRAKLCRILRNTGRSGETWLKAGDITIAEKRNFSNGTSEVIIFSWYGRRGMEQYKFGTCILPPSAKYEWLE